MLYRKVEKEIEDHLRSSDKIMIIKGARQIGKSYIIRYACKQVFQNYIEIDLASDKRDSGAYGKIRNTESLYLQLSADHGAHLGKYEDTVVFLDEIQEYPHLISMLKDLRGEKKYHFIASGSLLGITLRSGIFIPIGSVSLKDMYPLDFEEFLIASGVGEEVIGHIRNCFMERKSLEEPLHDTILGHFKKYLLSGGLPDAVNAFLETTNIVTVRGIQSDIRELYNDDAGRYEKDSGKKLKIRRIYGMIPSQMGSKKKRLVFKEIEDDKGKRSDDYKDETDYLVDSGISLQVKAISNPHFPLTESETKNLLKLYMNDVGMLTGVLYHNNIRAVLDDESSINLGSVYETVVAQELSAHGHKLFYYDNKSHGEVDYLIDDYDNLSVLPLEVKSGKDYTIHSALDNFLHTNEYGVKNAIVFSNEREVKDVNGITYLPIYDIMFL